MMARYPYLMKRGRPLDDEEKVLRTTSFVKYLRGELETYSADTLAHLYRDVTESQANEQNMTQSIYENLVKSHGYASIEDAEKSAKLQVKGTSD